MDAPAILAAAAVKQAEARSFGKSPNVVESDASKRAIWGLFSGEP